jgi:hypothetical protein
VYVARVDYDGKPLGAWRMGSDTGVDSLNDIGVDTFRNVYVSAVVLDNGFAPFGEVTATAGTFVARAMTVRASLVGWGKGSGREGVGMDQQRQPHY